MLFKVRIPVSFKNNYPKCYISAYNIIVIIKLQEILILKKKNH